MFFDKYPDRSPASDLQAMRLITMLDGMGVSRKGKNKRMVTVLAGHKLTNSVKSSCIIVSTSGTNSARGIDKALSSQPAYNFSVGLFSGTGNLTVPFYTDLELLFGENAYPADETIPFHCNGQRLCAEPKALTAAFLSDIEIDGMTTFWWGAGSNPYPDPHNNFKEYFAAPCEVCKTNQMYIMGKLAIELAYSKASFQRSISHFGRGITYFRSASMEQQGHMPLGKTISV